MRRLTPVLVATVLVAVVLGSAGPAFAAGGASSSTTTSSTLPVPKTTHPGVRRVLVISLPATSWDDLDLTKIGAACKASLVASMTTR